MYRYRSHLAPTISVLARSHSQSTGMSVGYLWERICWLSFIVPLFVTALRNPGYYGHLTYWTLALHSVYFTIDKESPQASTAIYLLQGASFVGAMAVFMGYTFISVGGMYRFGTWIEWENAVGKAAGTVTHDRSFAECAFFKSYEHLWPVFALVLDTYFSRDALKKTYAGKPPLRTMLLGLGLYLGYGTAWEQYSKATKGAAGTALEVYQQPEEFRSSYVLEKLGLSALSADVPEEAVFVNAQKVMLISFAAIMYRIYVKPLILPVATTAAKKKN